MQFGEISKTINKNTKSKGKIIGIVVGCIIAVVVTVTAIVFVYIYKKKKNENNIPIIIKEKNHSVFGSFSWHLKEVKE